MGSDWVVYRLLEHPKINARLVNLENETPLSLALAGDHDAVIRLLLDYFSKRYWSWDGLENEALFGGWAGAVLHQAGKWLRFADETTTQALHKSWHGWQKHFPEVTEALEKWTSRTGRWIVCEVSALGESAGHGIRLTLGDKVADDLAECADGVCKAADEGLEYVQEHSTLEQQIALSYVGFVIAGGAVGKIVGKAFKRLRKGLGKPQKWIWGKDKGVEKMIRQMQSRGWTPQQITEAIQQGKNFHAKNLVNKGNSATRYVHPKTGRSVVMDDVTKEIIHIGGDGFKY